MGDASWYRELFYILEGTFEITLLTETGSEHHVVPAGAMFVLPQGVWHKPAAPASVKFMHLTPGQSLHSNAENPRESDA
ncbi:MAG: mannose-6-phosphate isomerase-like protein (cupin superfamily) [Gammaproteobacteria bacterium]|jgi:mannose-6-phosphate isomerase-like protein (cupin superfamily)